MADEPQILYASRDKSRLVEEGDPEAGFIVNANDPGEFADLVKARREKPATKATAAPDATKAVKAPAEDKGK